MDIFNKFSESYNKLYRQNLQDFQARIKAIAKEDNWFTDYYPSFGIKKNICDFLFYGQAGGWSPGFNASRDIDEQKVTESIYWSNRYFAKAIHTPLDWVNVRWSNSVFRAMTTDKDSNDFYSNNGSTYWAFRSFFWKVVYKLTCDYYSYDRESWEWSKKVVWSNLFKIYEDEVNPSLFLRKLQLPVSVELVKKEIEELNPKYCIVLTNYSKWWDLFNEPLKTKKLSFDRSLSTIESFEQYNNSKIIVTTRPFLGSGEDHVTQILRLIED